MGLPAFAWHGHSTTDIGERWTALLIYASCGSRPDKYLGEIGGDGDFFAARLKVRGESVTHRNESCDDQHNSHCSQETVADNGEIDPMNLGGAGREAHVSCPSFK